MASFLRNRPIKKYYWIALFGVYRLISVLCQERFLAGKFK
jgi:hypothetical protein